MQIRQRSDLEKRNTVTLDSQKTRTPPIPVSGWPLRKAVGPGAAVSRQICPLTLWMPAGGFLFGECTTTKIAKPKDDMNAGYISAFAALAGSLIGGLTTFAAAWITQRQQANVQWLLQEKTRRQELYQQFIEEASKLYVDALIHDQAEIPPLVRACLERSYFACEPPDHQLDHGDSDPRFGRFGQGVEVLTQSARAVEPAEGAFDDPAPLQDPKFLALPRPFHDRKGALQNSGYPINQLAGVTPVCPNELQPRKAGDQPGEYLFGSITILDPGRMDHHDQKQTKDVDDYMTLTTQDALARVIAADPPFSVVFTV